MIKQPMNQKGKGQKICSRTTVEGLLVLTKLLGSKWRSVFTDIGEE